MIYKFMENRVQPIVEKGIRMPERHGGRYGTGGPGVYSYPFAQMVPGDSFALGPYTAAGMVRVSNSLVRARRRGLGKFAARKTEDGELRVWKVRECQDGDVKIKKK